MDSQVATAVIGGVFGVVTPIATYIGTHAYKNRSLLRLPEGRRKALDGSWRGTLHQEVGPDGKPIDAEYALQLSASRRVVRGEAHSRFWVKKQHHEARFVLEGGLLYERFFRFTYDSADRKALHFGVMMLELGADGRSLRGRFVAYGMLSQRLVYGSIDLEKQA
jgi:hypothetical protein